MNEKKDKEIVTQEIKSEETKAVKIKKLKKREKRLITVLIILGAYLVILAAAAVLIDGRHVEFRLNGTQIETIEYGTPYIDPGAEARTEGRVFGEGSRLLPVTAEGEVLSNKLGTYEINYTARLLGKTYTAKRVITVTDTKPPVIELAHTENGTASWFTGYAEEGYSAIDACDGDLTDKVERTEFADKIVYTVTDDSGNSTTVERPLEYEVTTPTISLSGGENISVYASRSFDDPGYYAQDSMGNDLTSLVQVNGDVCPYVVGTYSRTYSITNDRGDMASAVRTVNVIPVERPATIEPTTKTIYLTFDDGPGPYTSDLLDMLAKYGVKVTFFVTGGYPNSYDMIGRAYREGHSIGVHTFSHNYKTIYASEENYFDDFFAMEDIIYAQTGTYSSIFRFPGGSSNTVSRFNSGIITRLAEAMQAMGYTYFDWNVSSGDAGGTTVTDTVFQNIIDGASKRTYSVVLQHDIKDYSVNAVESVIIWGLNNGYTFKALDMTSPTVHHGIAN